MLIFPFALQRCDKRSSRVKCDAAYWQEARAVSNAASGLICVCFLRLVHLSLTSLSKADFKPDLDGLYRIILNCSSLFAHQSSSRGVKGRKLVCFVYFGADRPQIHDCECPDGHEPTSPPKPSSSAVAGLCCLSCSSGETFGLFTALFVPFIASRWHRAESLNDIRLLLGDA